ncbi:MAG: S8 family serine peptidase [Candidatus Rokubacteria bacterium]|nr:S8 family serine peptidase [Candidatus Rokubacteria bacterium]
MIALIGLLGVPTRALGQPEIDPVLVEVLKTAGLFQLIEGVVTFDHNPTPNDLLALKATGIEIRPFRVLPMVGVRGTATQLLGLLGLPGIRSYNGQLSYFLNESVPLVGADRVWTELGYTGSGVTVAIIDSGIDATHPDLPFGEKVIQNVKVGPNLFGGDPIVVEGLSNTDTTSGHGTHVASIAAGTGAALAGKYRGVAIDAKLVGVGAGETIFILTALEAFDWVLANRDKYGIRVISNSWGTRGSFSPDDPINVASKRAHDAGLVVVFSAGNDGPSLNTLSPFCVAPWVICVAAGRKDGRTPADFSSRGVPGDPLLHPTITAPGVDIAAARATTGIVMHTFFAVDLVNIGADALHYAVASGSSMATSHVSGTVALMLEANPRLSPDLVKSLLEKTATPMLGFGPHEVGTGYLNAYEAVRAARADTTPPSVAITAPPDGSTVSGTVTVAASASDDVGVVGVQFLLDGAPLGAEDTTAPYAIPWDTTTTTDGPHTLAAVARDAAGNRTTSAPVSVTVANAPASTGTRFEETDPAVTYFGNWYPRSRETLSGGTAVIAEESGARATFSFTGTAVSWIGYRYPGAGIARVYVDGNFMGEVDTYAPSHEPQAVVFTASGLPRGTHALTVEVTGTMNPAAGTDWVVVDAFDVTP